MHKRRQNTEMYTVVKVTHLKRLVAEPKFETLCVSERNIKFPSNEIYKKLSLELKCLGTKIVLNFLQTRLLMFHLVYYVSILSIL